MVAICKSNFYIFCKIKRTIGVNGNRCALNFFFYMYSNGIMVTFENNKLILVAFITCFVFFFFKYQCFYLTFEAKKCSWKASEGIRKIIKNIIFLDLFTFGLMYLSLL